jgi:type IV pilus assembly protein PilC
MQLDAGINVMDSLAAAAGASGSAVVSSAVRTALPEVRGGAQVAPVLNRSGAFPEHFIRSLKLGEDTGTLDRELPRVADYFQQDGIAAVKALTDWSTRLIYLGIMLYVAYRIVSVYLTTMKKVTSMFDVTS